MTITTEDNIAGGYAGNGSTAAFATPYFQKNEDIRAVLVTNATGAETVLTLTTHYTLVDALEPGGGTLTMLTPPAVGQTLYITIDPDQTQLAMIAASLATTQALDKLTQEIQALQLGVDRSVKVSESARLAGPVNTDLPATTDRANALLGFDASGDIELRFDGGPLLDASFTYDPVTHAGKYILLDVDNAAVEMTLPAVSTVPDGHNFWVFVNSDVNLASITVATTDQLRSINGYADHDEKAEPIYIGLASTQQLTSWVHVARVSNHWRVIGLLRENSGDDLRFGRAGWIDISMINATGTPGVSTYLRGDGAWVTPPVGGGGGSTVDSVVGEVGDVSATQIKTAVDALADTGYITDAERTKLGTVETGATADQSDAEIETAYDNQVAVVGQAEAEAGSSTTVRRWTALRVAQAIAALASGGGGSGTDMGYTSVQATPHSATGDGATDDTAAVQSAIDATADGGVVYFPPGDYSVNKLNVPHAKAMLFIGAGPRSSILTNRTLGQDIFRITDPGGATVQDRFVKVHVYRDLGFVMNTGTTDDTTTSLDRCTTAGLAVGSACIAYVTSFVPASSGDPGINAAWLHSFGLVQNCIGNVTTKHANHGCAFIYHGGNHYGWTYKDIWIEGLHYGIADCLPWGRRVTADAGTDRLTITNGTNPFQNNQTLFVAAHAHTGSMPGGLSRFQIYHVINRDASSVQISLTSGGAAVNITGAGSGAIYVYGSDDFAGEYAPDGISIDRLTHYAGRCPISLTNTENLHIGRVDSYTAIAALHLYGVQSLTRKQHLGVKIDAYYSESPQASTMPVGEDLIHVNAVAGTIDYLQFRGETANITDPPIRFDGEGLRVYLDSISSVSQAQPEIILDGDHIGLFGVAHSNTTLTDNGTNNYYLVKQSGSAAWKFQSASPYSSGTVSQVFGQAGVVDLATDYTLQALPATNAKLMIQQADNTYRHTTIANLPTGVGSGKFTNYIVPAGLTGSDFTTAVTAADAAGVGVYLPKGAYVWTDLANNTALTGTTLLHVVGDGPDKTLIEFGGGNRTTGNRRLLMQRPFRFEDFEVHDGSLPFSLDGNTTAISEASILRCHANNVGALLHHELPVTPDAGFSLGVVRVHDCKMETVRDGVHMRLGQGAAIQSVPVDRVEFYRNEVIDWQRYGLTADYDNPPTGAAWPTDGIGIARGNVIRDATTSTGNGFAINLSACESFIYDGNHITNNSRGGSGFDHEALYTKSYQGVICNNVIINSGQNDFQAMIGLKGQDSTQTTDLGPVVVCNNSIFQDQADTDSVFWVQRSNVTIENNRVICTPEGYVFAGQSADTYSNVVIRNNDIEINGTATNPGMQFFGDLRNWVLDGNTWRINMGTTTCQVIRVVTDNADAAIIIDNPLIKNETFINLNTGGTVTAIRLEKRTGDLIDPTIAGCHFVDIDEALDIITNAPTGTVRLAHCTHAGTTPTTSAGPGVITATSNTF